MNITFDKEELSIILGVPIEGIKLVIRKEGSTNFLTIYSDLDDKNIKNITEKDLKGEYLLLFELVNKCLLP